MAQSVEQLIRNQQVAGSSPASSSILKRAASRNRLAALFTGFRPTFHRRSGAAFSFLSFFFRAASPVTRLPCFAFYFCLVKRYSVANASPSPRIYRSFCFLLLTSPASSSILKRAASRNRLAALFTGFCPTFHRRSGARFSFFIFIFPRRIADDAFPLLRFLLLRRQTLFRRKRFLFRPTARFYFRRVVYKNCLFFR